MARRGLILAALILAAAAPAPASAQRRQKRRLARIQSELRRTLAELEALRADESSLLRDVSRLQGRDAASRRRIGRLQESIQRVEARRAGLRARLDATQRVDGFWTAALADELGRLPAAEAGRGDFYGSSDLWADEFRRAAIAEKVRHVRGLKGFRRETERAAADAGEQAGALARSRRRAQAERDRRLEEYESKKAELERTQARVAEAARRAQDLEENAKALTALIDSLGRAARGRGAAVPAALDLPRHSLPWPASGTVLSRFGREKDPELGTWIVRQGVTLGVPDAAPVAALAGGRVIFAGAFRSYGQVVILDHGGGFFSVYGRLGEILKAKGAAARRGETIARAAGRLYLEIRRGTQALDPLEWLQKQTR